jgi:hypothetical protein
MPNDFEMVFKIQINYSPSLQLFEKKFVANIGFGSFVDS